jgi:hypothetical protein
MPINITAAGAAGVHTLRRVNVNTEENYIYLKNAGIPASITQGTSYIYSDGVGQIAGVGDGSLVYANRRSSEVLQLLTEEDEVVDLTGVTPGSVQFNTPVVYETQLNLGLATPSNQAFKYYTAGTPLTGLVSGNTYFLKNQPADFTGVQSLYTIASDTHTFTTCGQTGRVGPTNSQILAGYSTSWHGQYLRQGDYIGYQDWTVPVSGTYQFTARGASGHAPAAVTRTITFTSLTTNVATITTSAAHGFSVGQSVTIAGATNTVYNGTYVITQVPNTTQFRYNRTNVNIGNTASGGTATLVITPGRGAIVQGRVSLTKGEVITIAVGQRGAAPTSASIYGGSGGGTFIVRKTGSEPLFVAGGGSADAGIGGGRDAVTTPLGGSSSNGQPAGGALGFGGLSAPGRTSGGGGFLGRGIDVTTTGFEGLGGGAFVDGLTSGTNSRIGGAGGFGGGSQASPEAGQTGGAGGYSGGGGSRSIVAGQAGGGGGSYIIPSATNVATSNGLYDSSGVFNGSAITNLSSFNTGEGSVVMTLVESFTTGNTVFPTAADANADTNKISIAPAGSSYHAFVPINYDSQNDLIHSATAHGFTSGVAITPKFNGTPPAGIQNGSIYYVDRVNNFTYRLSTVGTAPYNTINLTTPSSRETTTSSTISRVIVNTDTGVLTINNHGFLVNQPVQYDNGTGDPGFNTQTVDGNIVWYSIRPLQHLATYYVAEVLNANQIRLKSSLTSPTPISFVSPGLGTAHSFIFVTVNALENTLYIPNHGLASGQSVIYNNGGGTSITGLVNGTTYYVDVVDNSIVRLSLEPDLSPIVDITAAGTGTQSLVVTSLNFETNTITIPDHGFAAGELVQYDSKGQTVINGLTTATPYYVIFVDGDNIRLATTPENADADISVDLVASPAGVGRHSLQSLSKTPDGTYTILTAPTPDTFTVLARGRVPELTKIFNPRSSIDLNINAFYIPSHGLITGTKVVYSQGDSATDIGGLVDEQEYFVVGVNRDYLRLASTAENAAAGITIDVTDFGTGVAHSFTSSQINGNITGGGTVTVSAGSVLVNGSGTSFSKILKVGDSFRLFPPNTTLSFSFAPADVDTVNNRINKAHTFTTGDAVKFSAGGGVAPTPLVNEYYYFARSVTSSQLTLHNSAADAESNTSPLDFSTQGTAGGTPFTLTRTTPVGPIIRRITAVGSDTQITVDRPYSSAYSAVGYSYPTFIYVRPEGYSLHRPFDGGVEMSVGSGTSLGQIVRQTRKYFRYQSGKGIQTSAGINFKPSIDLESMIRFSATQITCKTRRPHGLVSGLFVDISQATDSFGVPSQVYNGQFQVTVVDLTTFRITSPVQIEVGAEDRAYGFPQFYVREWSGGAVRSGMFDFQNGMFFEFDGDKLYAVRRSSTQQTAGTVAALQGSELIFGTGTNFEAQLDVGDYVVMRGQSYRITQIDSNTRMSVRPEYKGSSGTEKEFDPATVVNTTTDTFTIVGHGFSNRLPVVYNSIDGDPIGGLVNGRTYYVDLTDNNRFKLLGSPDAETNVDLSSVGSTNIHSLTPAKSGIIVTKTVDTRVPQEEFSIDPLDGSGPTGYNLDLSRIQMVYMDYSWYGAGKIRFGFKTADGQVQYCHEFVHNNSLYESYFRSGNLPARYEVATYDNPTYIPFLFHWGTSVMMDGRFDDDNAYLFTAGSQTLTVPGTTSKSFASTSINTATEIITIQSHGFNSGDIIQFQSIATNGLPGLNTQNPATTVTTNQTRENITNSARYSVVAASLNTVALAAETTFAVATTAQSTTTVTVVTAANHNLSNGMRVGIYGSTRGILPGVFTVTVTNATTFTYTATNTATVTSGADTDARVAEVLNFTSAGNTQYTYFLYPNGSLNNTSGPNYQPLISLRLSPSVSSGLTGKLGDRDVINRMQLRLKEIGISSNQLVDVKLLLNPRLNNLNFTAVDSPSLTQIVEHTSADTVSGGVQVYNFRGSGGTGGNEETTTVDVSSLFELSNSILGGDSIYPDGPDIITVAVSRLTGNATTTSAKLSWSEAQA